LNVRSNNSQGSPLVRHRQISYPDGLQKQFYLAPVQPKGNGLINSLA
jgi:hypothetical protein